MADWHPKVNAVEVAAGAWWMRDPTHDPYVVVKLVEVCGERSYRVVIYAPESANRNLIGYYGNLRAATFGANLWVCLDSSIWLQAESRVVTNKRVISAPMS